MGLVKIEPLSSVFRKWRIMTRRTSATFTLDLSTDTCSRSIELVECNSKCIIGSCGKNGPPSTILSFSRGLGLGCGFLVRSFHMIRIICGEVLTIDKIRASSKSGNTAGAIRTYATNHNSDSLITLCWYTLLYPSLITPVWIASTSARLLQILAPCHTKDACSASLSFVGSFVTWTLTLLESDWTPSEAAGHASLLHHMFTYQFAFHTYCSTCTCIRKS